MTNDFTHRLLMKDEYANRVGAAAVRARRGDAGGSRRRRGRSYVPGSRCR
jgi:hypothetical protein